MSRVQRAGAFGVQEVQSVLKHICSISETFTLSIPEQKFPSPMKTVVRACMHGRACTHVCMRVTVHACVRAHTLVYLYSPEVKDGCFHPPLSSFETGSLH